MEAISVHVQTGLRAIILSLSLSLLCLSVDDQCMTAAIVAIQTVRMDHHHHGERGCSSHPIRSDQSVMSSLSLAVSVCLLSSVPPIHSSPVTELSLEETFLPYRPLSLFLSLSISLSIREVLFPLLSLQLSRCCLFSFLSLFQSFFSLPVCHCSNSCHWQPLLSSHCHLILLIRSAQLR